MATVQNLKANNTSYPIRDIGALEVLDAAQKSALQSTAKYKGETILNHSLWADTTGKVYEATTRVSGGTLDTDHITSVSHGGTTVHDGTYCYGKGIYVAYSWDSGNKLLWSEDGITWTKSASGPTGDVSWANIIYADSIGYFFAACYDRGVWKSTDGKNWTSCGQPISYMTGVAYGSGRLIVVRGDNTQYAYSTDLGDNWSTGSFPNQVFRDIVSDGTHFVTGAAQSSNRINYSADGVTWQSISVGSSSNNKKRAAYANGVFVVCGSSESAWSTNGTTWTTSSGGADRLVGGIAGFVQFSGSTTSSFRYSADGKTWTTISLPATAYTGTILTGESNYIITSTTSYNNYKIPVIASYSATLTPVTYTKAEVDTAVSTAVAAIQPNTLSHAVTKTISASAWQPVSGSDTFQAYVTGLTGMTTSSKVIVTPTPSYIDVYGKCGIFAVTHAGTTIVMNAKKKPDTTVGINVTYTEG